MRFESLLIHRCTLVKHTLIGKDDYNQDVYDDVTIENVPCRVDQVKKFVSRDENGENYITQNILFTGSTQALNNDMHVRGIEDKQGNTVLAGEFTLESATPVYGRVRIHHYEATLKGG